MKKGVIIAIVVLVFVLIGAFFIFNQKPSSNVNNTSTQESNEIAIQNFAFSPAVLDVKVGEVVTWKNEDSASHTIVSDSGNEISSNSLAKEETYSHTFSIAGTYDYHCGIHASMKGKVIVS